MSSQSISEIKNVEELRKENLIDTENEVSEFCENTYLFQTDGFEPKIDVLNKIKEESDELIE